MKGLQAKPKERWEAKFAGERIAVITSDPELEQHIREEFRDQPYELVCVSDFFDHQDELIDTSLGLVDTLQPQGFETIYRIGKASYWENYPTIRIVRERRQPLPALGNGSPSIDVEIAEGELSSLVPLVKHQIGLTRFLEWG